MIPWILSAVAAELVVGVDAPTVQATVDLAQSGDTVVLAAGETYRECVDTHGRSLDLEGTGATLDATGLCDNAFRVVSGETVVVRGLTVQNDGARAFDLEWSTVTLQEVVVRGAGRSDWQGGAAWTYGAALTTVDSVFEDNQGSDGGAIYHYAYTTWTDQGSRFAGNVAAGSGGAVSAYYDNLLVLDGSRFTGNSAGYYGGAIGTWNLTDLQVTGAEFTGNSAPTTGGGAVFYYPTDTSLGVLDLGGSTFTENSAVDGGAVWTGWVGDAWIHDNAFTSNVATNSGGAVLVYVADQVRVEGNLLCTNQAWWGGGVSVQWSNVDSWSRNRFVENAAAEGGGVHRYASYAGSLRWNTWVGNVASAWGGGYDAVWAYADFRDNVVVDSEGGSGVYTEESWSAAYSTLAYDGFSGNQPVDAAGYFAIVADAGHVQTDDPGFVRWTADGDCADDDLRLRGASPFKDAGDPASLDLDGTRADQGAYGGPDQAEEDRDGDGVTTTRDCDDTDPLVLPGATEVCDGVDQDCNGVRDDGASDVATWYLDEDGDGWGDEPVTGCEAPDGAVDRAGDCDDSDPWVHPEASDLPGDGMDADCDGVDNQQVYPPAIEPESGGCGCGTGGPPAPGGLLALGLALVLRRRSLGAAATGR